MIWAREYFVAPEPSAVVADYDEGKDITEIPKAAIAGMVNAYEDNWSPYNSNIRWYRAALLFVSSGMVVGAVGTVIS